MDKYKLTLYQKLKSFFRLQKKTQTVENISFNPQDENDSIIQKFLEARELKASEIMIPRANLSDISINLDMHLDQINQKFVNTGALKLIVYKRDLDEILGIITLQDIFVYIVKRNNNININKLIKKVIYAARSTKTFSLFYKMQQENIDVAVILDEYGGVEGIVTLEKIIEEMLGEKVDNVQKEKSEENKIKKINEHSYIIEGSTLIQEIEEHLGELEFLSEEIGSYETIGGFILSYLDYMPIKGEKFVHPENVEIEVLDTTPRKIKCIKMTFL